MNPDLCAECRVVLDRDRDRFEWRRRLFCSERCVALFRWKSR